MCTFGHGRARIQLHVLSIELPQRALFIRKFIGEGFLLWSAPEEARRPCVSALLSLLHNKSETDSAEKQSRIS